MASTPAWAATPRNEGGILSVANTNRDGSQAGTYVTILSAGANGTRIDYISINSLGTTVDGIIRFFIERAGGDRHLWKEVIVTPVTPSGTVPTYSKEIFLSYPLLLAANQALLAASHTSDDFVVIAIGADL